MILDPDACVYDAGMKDAYICDLWPWCVYLWCGVFSLRTNQRTNEPTNQRTNQPTDKAILGVGLPAAQFHFRIIFGYELNTVYFSNLIDQKSIAVQAVCKQDVNKILGTSSTLASKLHQIFCTIFSDENGYENIWKIFALGRAVGRNFLFSSFFLSTISMVSTQNFGILRPALHFFCK